MINDFKKAIPVVLSFIFTLWIVLAVDLNHSYSESKKPIVLYFFWGDGCPHCAKEKEFLKKLKSKYPQLEIKDYEVWYNKAPRDLLLTMSKSYGINPNGVPVTFIGDKSFIGFNSEIAVQIEQTLKFCLKNTCEDPLYKK